MRRARLRNPLSSIGHVVMISISSCKSLRPSRRARRVIAGPVGRAAPDPEGVPNALRRAERSVPCCPACLGPFLLWSARPGALGWSVGHALRGPEGSVWSAISPDTAARLKYIPNREKCSSNDTLPLPLLLENTTIQRTGVLNNSPFWGRGSVSPRARGSALAAVIRKGTMAILTRTVAPLSALALYAHAGRAAGRWWVRTRCLWLAAGSGFVRCRSPRGDPHAFQAFVA